MVRASTGFTEMTKMRAAIQEFRKRDPCADGTDEALVVSRVRMRHMGCVHEQLVGS